MFLLPVAEVEVEWTVRGIREHPGNLSPETREGNRIYNSQERSGERRWEWPSDKNQINPQSMNFMMPNNDGGNDRLSVKVSSDDQT